MMKEGYISDYQTNYQINLNEKQANIDEFLETMEDKKNQMSLLGKQKEQDMSCLRRFFEMKKRLFYYRVSMKYWKKYLKHMKEKKRVAAYTRNSLYRRRLTQWFRGWNKVSHTWGKERIDAEESSFRKNLEFEKLTMWSSKVDQLMLYMAQLEDKIKTEVKAREDLTVTYETSLNKGVSTLNRETNLLADNPLIHEISIVVAKQLLSKSKDDPEALNAMLTQEQRQQLAHLTTSLSGNGAAAGAGGQ
jgi:hypothetical protein